MKLDGAMSKALGDVFFEEQVRAIVQSCRTNMVPFMDVNNMNDYDMVNPAESKGAIIVSKTNMTNLLDSIIYPPIDDP